MHFGLSKTLGYHDTQFYLTWITGRFLAGLNLV